jgi:hypothetical protein
LIERLFDSRTRGIRGFFSSQRPVRIPKDIGNTYRNNVEKALGVEDLKRKLGADWRIIARVKIVRELRLEVASIYHDQDGRIVTVFHSKWMSNR